MIEMSNWVNKNIINPTVKDPSLSLMSVNVRYFTGDKERFFTAVEDQDKNQKTLVVFFFHVLRCIEENQTVMVSVTYLKGNESITRHYEMSKDKAISYTSKNGKKRIKFYITTFYIGREIAPFLVEISKLSSLMSTLVKNQYFKSFIKDKIVNETDLDNPEKHDNLNEANNVNYHYSVLKTLWSAIVYYTFKDSNNKHSFVCKKLLRKLSVESKLFSIGIKNKLIVNPSENLSNPIFSNDLLDKLAYANNTFIVDYSEKRDLVVFENKDGKIAKKESRDLSSLREVFIKEESEDNESIKNGTQLELPFPKEETNVESN